MTIVLMASGRSKRMIERIIQVWIGDDYIELPIKLPKDMNEDDMYEAAMSYVMSSISIDLI